MIEKLHITVNQTEISFYNYGPWKEGPLAARRVLLVAKQDEETDPSGAYLGRQFVESHIPLILVTELKKYITSSAGARRGKFSEDEKTAMSTASELLSSALAYMQTQDIQERPRESITPSASVFSTHVHQPRPGKQYKPEGFNPDDK
jgi:hypothetical protein